MNSPVPTLLNKPTSPSTNQHMPQIKPVSKLLASSKGDLKSLLEHAHYLQALTQLLRDAIDPILAEHITVANVREDTAIVTADSPAWLTKIRYLAPTILSTLKHQSNLSALKKIQFKVQLPVDPVVSNHETRRANLSSTSAKVLRSAASGIQDPELANALQRLSKQTSK